MKKALIISYSNIENDTRIKRQIETIKNKFEITLLASNTCENDSFKFIKIDVVPAFSIVRKIKRAFYFFGRIYNRYYWDDYKLQIVNDLKNNHYDLIIANDIHTLPLALKIKKEKNFVMFDAHEYHPEEFNDRLYWKLFIKPYVKYLCRKYIKETNVFTTVSKSIANKYNENYGKKAHIITNAAIYHDIEPSVVDNKKIKIIHHGATIRSRKIELMIEMAKALDSRFHTYFMLTNNDKEYLKELKEKAKNHERIKFIEAINSEEIIAYTKQFDIGIYLLPSANFNDKYALPNKLFEYIQARLCLIVSPNPEMKEFVEKNKIGIACLDYSPQTMAQVINNLNTEKIQEFKAASNLAAKNYNYEENKQIFLSLINNI